MGDKVDFTFFRDTGRYISFLKSSKQIDRTIENRWHISQILILLRQDSIRKEKKYRVKMKRKLMYYNTIIIAIIITILMHYSTKARYSYKLLLI